MKRGAAVKIFKRLLLGSFLFICAAALFFRLSLDEFSIDFDHPLVIDSARKSTAQIVLIIFASPTDGGTTFFGVRDSREKNWRRFCIWRDPEGAQTSLNQVGEISNYTDVVWSGDESIVAITDDEFFCAAYDFSSHKIYPDKSNQTLKVISLQISQLLKIRGGGKTHPGVKEHRDLGSWSWQDNALKTFIRSWRR